jgi:PmbA protein
MNESQALDIAHQAVELARASGASASEVTVSSVQRFAVEARDARLEKLERTTGKYLHARIFVNGRKSALSTSDFTNEGLSDAIARAVAIADRVADDPFSALPETFATDVPDLDLYDAAIATREDDAKIEDALALERRIRSDDARVANSSGSHYNDAASTVAMANSAGFAGSYRSTRASRSTAPIALDGEHKRIGHYGTASRRFGELEDVDHVARLAVRRAVELFGARTPSTMRVPVIFERDIAAAVLDDLFGAISAANVAAGNSWLVGRVGDAVGSEAVTIVDDGRLPGRIGSSPFDGEGSATRRTVVMNRGRLETFLYDTYYARKLGSASTGNSTGSGIGPNNFYLEPGPRSLEELIAATPRGVLVLDTIGFATEHASGTYSRGARGFFIENGELAYPIDQFTIAGRFPEMLAGVDAVANDLRHDASVVSPSFRVAEMTVSGN